MTPTISCLLVARQLRHLQAWCQHLREPTRSRSSQTLVHLRTSGWRAVLLNQMRAHHMQCGTGPDRRLLSGARAWRCVRLCSCDSTVSAVGGSTAPASTASVARSGSRARRAMPAAVTALPRSSRCCRRPALCSSASTAIDSFGAQGPRCPPTFRRCRTPPGGAGGWLLSVVDTHACGGR